MIPDRRNFADRYKTGSVFGHVDAIEVWNEPNLQREWGDTISPQSAADYVRLLQLTYATVKAVDPGIQVITAGLSPTGISDGTAAPDDQYLQWMYSAGLSGNYDVLGLNANAQVADPTAAPGSVDGFADGSFYFRRVEQMRAEAGPLDRFQKLFRNDRVGVDVGSVERGEKPAMRGKRFHVSSSS